MLLLFLSHIQSSNWKPAGDDKAYNFTSTYSWSTLSFKSWLFFKKGKQEMDKLGINK